MLRTENLQSLAVRSLLSIVEVTEHRVSFDARLVVRTERCLTLKLQPPHQEHIKLCDE